MKKINVLLTLLILSLFPNPISAKEIALTFDDAPFGSSRHYDSEKRTNELIEKLKKHHVPSVLIFANACKKKDAAAVVRQLKKYRDNGHFIGNHTCSHPRLDDVGFSTFSKDAEKGDTLLAPLFAGQKFFRFPYLNESNDEKLRDQMRDWLKANRYRNGMVSIDNEDHIFSFKINQAKQLGKKIDYEKVKQLFLNHLLGAAEYYDELAVKSLGYSPKHVLLLHEMDATVMFIDSLIIALRQRGWTIIGVDKAYQDRIYFESPKNTGANNGILSQVVAEKTGEKKGYSKFEEIKAELDKILGL